MPGTRGAPSDVLKKASIPNPAIRGHEKKDTFEIFDDRAINGPARSSYALTEEAHLYRISVGRPQRNGRRIPDTRLAAENWVRGTHRGGESKVNSTKDHSEKQRDKAPHNKVTERSNRGFIVRKTELNTPP